MFEMEEIKENGVHLLTRYWPCPNCNISGAFMTIGPNVRCKHCESNFSQKDIKPVYVLPDTGRTSPDAVYGKDMLVSIFDLNKRYTDFVRDNVKPRKDLAENVIADLLEEIKVHGIKLTPDENLNADKAIHDLRLMRNAIAIQGESSEYMDEMPWKWWGRGKHDIDKHKAAMELIDMIHFIMVAFDDLGYQPIDIYEFYKEKQTENRVRYFEKKGWGNANR